MQIDLTIPWSWFKLDSCHLCNEDAGQIPNKKQFNQLECRSPCSITNKYNKTYTHTVSSTFKETKKNAAIVSRDSLLYGVYVYDKLTLSAYDPNEKRGILQIIGEELRLQNIEDLEELVILKKFKMLGIDKIIGYSHYASDGGLGFGFLDQETDDDKIEDDTNLLGMLVQNIDDEKKLSKRVFGIYINSIGPYVQDHILTLGDMNAKYALKESENELSWIQLVPGRGYFWAVPLSEIRIRVPEFSADRDFLDLPKNIITPITIDKKEAIISLSTSFIALPYKQLAQIVESLNKNHQSQCSIVDENYHAVYCKHIWYAFMYHFAMDIYFDNVE